MNSTIEKAIDETRDSKSYNDSAVCEQLKVWRGRKINRHPLLLNCPLNEDEAKSFQKHSYKDIHYDSKKKKS